MIAWALLVFILVTPALAGNAATPLNCINGHVDPVVNTTCVCDEGWTAADCNHKQLSQRRANFYAIFLGWTGAPFYYLGYIAPAILITIINVPFVLLVLMGCKFRGMEAFFDLLCCCCLMRKCRRITRACADVCSCEDGETPKEADPSWNDYEKGCYDDTCCWCTMFIFLTIFIIFELIWWAVTTGLVVSKWMKDSDGYHLI